MSESKNAHSTRAGLGAKLTLGIRTSKSEIPKRAPPVLHEVGRLAASVAAVASGSATGNPRNKCALQPGHSLMDWIRLGGSGRDLTGVGSRAGTLAVTPRQLAQHSTPNDAWIAIRGRVYNVTHYLPFHPGGPEELMRGAGKDATKLFDQIHAWVNYEQILQKCYIGRLIYVDPDTLDTVETFFGATTSTSTNNLDVVGNNSVMLTNKILKTSSSAPTSPNKGTLQTNDLFKSPSTTTVTNKEDKAILKEEAAVNVTIPKFDWIQKTESVTFIFYTKSYSNSEILITLNDSDASNNGDNEQIIIIKLIYDNRIFNNEINLKNNSVKWPCRTNMNYETGKCEIIAHKNNTFIWSHFGTIKQDFFNLSVRVCETKDQCTIVDRIKVSHNTYLILLKRNDSTIDVIPIGRHIRVYVTVKGQQHSRSYTPVPPSLVRGLEPATYSFDCLCLMIKSYPQGLISSNMCNMPIGSVIEVSPAAGGFHLSDLEDKDKFLLIAAGTGLTPMLNLITFILGRRNRRCQKIKLLFFNRTEKDILWRDQFETLMKNDSRFSVEHILSDASDKWNGKKGRVDKIILQASVQELVSENDEIQTDLTACYTCICGPSPFIQITEQHLKDIDIDGAKLSTSQIYCFLG